IHHPDEVTKAEMALLAEAARKWESLRLDWEKYCESEQEKIVKPILVVQIENGTKTRLSKTDLSDAITAIENSTGRRLTSKEMAHAMHDTGDLVISERVVRRVDASKIEHDKNIGVVFFKTSLSTGWDCPRAEVMMSFRKAEDHTYIAQLLGRMVRTPLARRVEKNASLNDVHLYLPYFDEDAVQSVIDSLRNTEEVPPSETGSSKNLVILEKSEAMEQVFKFLSDLPTYRVNASRAQSPLRRYFSLARQLTLDDINTASWGEAKSKITSWMANEVNRLKEAGEFEKIARTVSYVDLSTISITNNGENVVEGSGYQVSSSNIDIDRLFEESGRALGNGLHMDFWRSTVNRSRPAFDVKVEAITVSRSKNSLKNLELLAETQFNELYDAHKREINSLKESRKVNYETLRLATAEPVEVSWTLPENIAFSISDDSLSFAKHLYVDKEGQFFTELGPWELEVIKEELANNSVIGWLRNLPRKPWSFEIPYESGGAIRPMFPDIITVRQEADNLVVDIIEPHDPSLSDNFEKAKGLAQFAEKHGHRFGRIELVRKKGNHFYRLDLNKTSNIKDVLLVTSNPQLDKIFEYSAT
ncbi:MAG: type III deoxyribonuclease, partial [Pseudomonadota bacterium]|nr:type III deoxyribonuclease [Pseudomonadota bacterium]